MKFNSAPRLSPSPLLAMCLLALLWPPIQGLAASNDPQQPIEIEADSADIDEGRGTTVYQGNVIVHQGQTLLTADKVTVYHKQRKAQRIVAEGNTAHFSQKSPTKGRDVNGEAQRIEYDVGSETLILQGKAMLAQGRDLFSSDRIVYDRHKMVVKAGGAARGKKRVHVTIDPSQK